MIKNIIFDLGGIFMTLDYQKTEDLFVQYGVKDFKQLFNQHHASPVFEQLETGKISPEAFYDAFRTISQTSLSNEQIEEAWNAMLLSFPLDRLEWLKNIKSKYNIYLYSNTNIIHYEAFMKLYEHVTGTNSFNDFFIKAYYSHEFGYRKPHSASYLKILEEQHLLAAETLFIDDTLVNIEGAQAAGLQTIHLVPPMTVLSLEL